MENMFALLADSTEEVSSPLSEEKVSSPLSEEKVFVETPTAVEVEVEGFSKVEKPRRKTKKEERMASRTNKFVQEFALSRGLADGNKLILMYGDAMQRCFEDALFCPDLEPEHELGVDLVHIHAETYQALVSSRKWKSPEVKQREIALFYQHYVPALIKGYSTSPKDNEEYYSTPWNFFASLRVIFNQFFAVAFRKELEGFSHNREQILKWREQWLAHLPPQVPRRRTDRYSDDDD